MSFKVKYMFLLPFMFSIFLHGNCCTLKLYSEKDYQGDYIEEFQDSKRIIDMEVKSLEILGNCVWRFYR